MAQSLDDNLSVKPLDARFMIRVFAVFAVLALVSLLIFMAGRTFGHALALGGHTEDTAPFEAVIGNNVLTVPANMIRNERQRRHGVRSRLDLYIHWPSLAGYHREIAGDFNHAGNSRRIVFLAFEERAMSRDMTGRLAPIYDELIIKPGIAGPAGLTLYGFTEQSGYLDELLAVGAQPGEPQFVARCLAGDAAERSLAACERDLHVGDHLSLTYRFPRQLLDEWRRLDAAMLAVASRLLQ